MTTLDKALFKHLARKLEGLRPEKVVEYYFTHLIVKNGSYFKAICKEYKLPSDILKIHKRICMLSEFPITNIETNNLTLRQRAVK